MTMLVTGLILWVLAHFFKRLAPAARAGLDDAVGAGPAKGIVALVLLAAVVLMVTGYRAAPFDPVYEPPAWGVYVNNAAMLIAIALLGAGSSKGRARSLMRHPMLTGVIVWGFAHLIANGDLASVVLFAGLPAWALANMMLINAREPEWQRPEPGPVSGDVLLGVITVVLFAVIALIHSYVGPPPFGA
ncbi:MAG: NnrU family protein [Paracoccaceae bacterium]